MKVIQDDLWLCVECMLYAVNGDLTGIDCDDRATRVECSVQDMGPHLVPDFDSESSEGIREFSSCGCDCCQSGLAGEMHRFAVLGE